MGRAQFMLETSLPLGIKINRTESCTRTCVHMHTHCPGGCPNGHIQCKGHVTNQRRSGWKCRYSERLKRIPGIFIITKH